VLVVNVGALLGASLGRPFVRPAAAQVGHPCRSELTIWLNAFIPSNAPGAITPTPGFSQTAIKGPLGTCYLTDQRGCSSNILGSARMHSEIEIDVSGTSVSSWTVVSYKHQTGPTIEVNCNTGNELCQDLAPNTNMSFGPLRVIDPANAEISLYSAVSVACPAAIPAPPIQYAGIIYLSRISSTAIRVAFVGHTTKYPKFEMYATFGIVSPQSLFCQGPFSQDPFGLYDGLVTPASGAVTLSRCSSNAECLPTDFCGYCDTIGNCETYVSTTGKCQSLCPGKCCNGKCYECGDGYLNAECQCVCWRSRVPWHGCVPPSKFNPKKCLCEGCDKTCLPGLVLDTVNCQCECETSTDLYCSADGCRDVLTDNQHCGTCRNVCTGGKSCQSGTCLCPGTLADCGGICRDLQIDAQHCGACGNTCLGGKICQNGICVCPPDRTDCGGVCRDLQTDSQHCGACDTMCTGGKTCQNGVCVCLSGRTDCGGVCRDLQTDSQHCGTCGTTCTGGKVCHAGACVCPPGTTDCGGACRNLQVDPQHCGACGLTCTGGKLCQNATCVCQTGHTDCAGVCRNLADDPNHCRVCNRACAPGETCCSGWCTDLTASPDCGVCGRTCTGGKTCLNRACRCPTGTTECNGVCRDLTSDRNNCGTCGRQCPSGQSYDRSGVSKYSYTTVCLSGACYCPATHYACGFDWCASLEYPVCCGTWVCKAGYRCGSQSLTCTK
jgi:hypothetical protein